MLTSVLTPDRPNIVEIDTRPARPSGCQRYHLTHAAEGHHAQVYHSPEAAESHKETIRQRLEGDHVRGGERRIKLEYISVRRSISPTNIAARPNL